MLILARKTQPDEPRGLLRQLRQGLLDTPAVVEAIFLPVEAPSRQRGFLVYKQRLRHRQDPVGVQEIGLDIQNLEGPVDPQGLGQALALRLPQIRVRQQQRLDVGVGGHGLHQFRGDPRLDMWEWHASVREVHYIERGIVQVHAVHHPQHPVPRLLAVLARIWRQIPQILDVIQLRRVRQRLSTLGLLCRFSLGLHNGDGEAARSRACGVLRGDCVRYRLAQGRCRPADDAGLLIQRDALRQRRVHGE
mmetsp:Transcript_69940/g.202906  ORF Transcript_69940/g.202906 Transcript_69940/m.202906 type:complete len:248 (-) Transcript_69940:2271-3014(-)